MKLKYTLGALMAAFALASCSLDVNMYDGVTGEDVTARNIVELSQGSYSMLKYDGGLIDYGYYFGLMVLTTFHGEVLRPTRNSISTTIAVKSTVQLQNMLGSWVIVLSVTVTR